LHIEIIKNESTKIRPNRPKPMKIHPTTSGLAISDTGPGPYDAIQLALLSPPGSGAVVQLKKDSPYRRGLFPNEPTSGKSTGVICPYCGVPVLLYEYPEFGFCMLVCRCLGFFTRLPINELTQDDWVHLVRHCATTWIEVEANEQGGCHGGGN
jgi:hypothetical protein